MSDKFVTNILVTNIVTFLLFQNISDTYVLQLIEFGNNNSLQKKKEFGNNNYTVTISFRLRRNIMLEYL